MYYYYKAKEGPFVILLEVLKKGIKHDSSRKQNIFNTEEKKYKKTLKEVLSSRSL